MCGISGFNFPDKGRIRKMVSLQNHRGPDGHGIYVDGQVSLGNNRLAIIDLSAKGRQPMCNEDETIWIVFNGEIYNFLQLRAELKKHRFSSHTDTEVLLHAYEEWGPDFVRRLNGMWAFAIYDTKKKILVLSRDRFGKKPLYYCLKEGALIFASELKSILAHKEVKRTIDEAALDLYLALSWIPAPFTIYKDIRKLPKSSYAVFDLRQKKFSKIEKYYSLPDQQRSGAEETIKKMRGLMDDSVGKRMIADVPVGAFLSGGLDSSAITATMLKSTAGRNLHTFSVGFDGKYDESKYALAVAELLGTVHHHQYFGLGDFEKLSERIYFYYDEPFADMSMYPTFKVSQLARKHVTVSLSGDGGDELFGGYGHYVNYRRIDALRKSPVLLRHAGKSVMSAAYVATRSRYALKFLNDFETSLDEKRIATPTGRTPHALEGTARPGSLLEASIDFDLNYTLVDGYLVKIDRASMANSLEIRCPFLDYRIVAAARGIPLSDKVSLNSTKILFRKIISDRVPEEITSRTKKMGFTPPITEWMFGESGSMAEDKLEKLRGSGLVDAGSIQKAISYLGSHSLPHAQDVFNLVSLQLWREEWLQ